MCSLALLLHVGREKVSAAGFEPTLWQWADQHCYRLQYALKLGLVEQTNESLEETYLVRVLFLGTSFHRRLDVL